MFQHKFLLYFWFSICPTVKTQLKIIFYRATQQKRAFFQILHACSPFNFENTTLMHINFFSYFDTYCIYTVEIFRISSQITLMDTGCSCKKLIVWSRALVASDIDWLELLPSQGEIGTPHPLRALVSKNWIDNEWVITEVFL